jgi:hypothetical protein
MTQAELEETKNLLAKSVLIEHDIILAHEADLPKVKTEMITGLQRMSRQELRNLAAELQKTPPDKKWRLIVKAYIASDDARPEAGD